MLEAGTVIGGDYRVERKLSEGGMGAVFVAEQISTGAKRALKIIRPELLHEPKLRARFEQEARVTARIASDHVVSIIASGFDEKAQLPWLAMELLSGETLLRTVADDGPLPPRRALAILKQLAHAIDAAHAAGVVHRDLKPDNIFLAESRRSGTPILVKVLDFGIARIVREAHVTRTDALGTPLWMAPEQASTGEAIGTWTDIWPFGLIAFYVLTGRSYWLSANGEGSTLSVVKEICVNPLPAATERARELGFSGSLPNAFDTWFARLVCREVSARFASAGRAISALEEVFGARASDPALARASDPALAATSAQSHKAVSVAPVTPDGATELALPSASADVRVPASGSATPDRSSGGVPPPAVSITNPKDTPRPRSRRAKIAAAAAVVAVVGLAFGVRAARQRALVRECSSGVVEACGRACEHGDRPACTREAVVSIDSRDAVTSARAAEALLRACNEGTTEACAALGRARAFPVGADLKRDRVRAVELLEKSCVEGQGCALLGALKDLGWPGIQNGSAHYYGRSCAEAPTTPDATLDCAFAVAHDRERPGAAVSTRQGDIAAQLRLVDACAARGGDICGLAWLDARSPEDTRSAYERGCDSGSSLACNNLGAMRAEGVAGLDANPAVARETFERACAAGEPAACNNLGFVLGGFTATTRRGPRGATVYKLRCSGALHVGCAGWGDSVEPVPAGTPVSMTDAVAAFERACKEGLTTACVNLGAFAYVGRGTTRDRQRAEKLFADACFRGDPSACGEEGAALLALRMDHPRDVEAGFGFLERSCKGGEKDACLALYGHMANGLPDHKHEAEGVAGLKRLAKEMLYSHTLIQLYETGAEGLAPDPEQARRIAVEQCEAEMRCADAAYYLSRGIGGKRDEGRALDALDRACDHDDFASCTELGTRYREGRGVGRDPTRAVELFRHACDGADPYACNELSRAYANGEGTARDLAKAVALARDACESGASEGCATYGVMTAEGRGVPKDVEAAIPYLAFGCRRAVANACTKLQELHQPIPELDL